MANEKLVTQVVDDDWEPPEDRIETKVTNDEQDHVITNPDTSTPSPLVFLAEIGADLERAILAKTAAKKAHRRASNALTKAQAISVTMGEVDKSIEKAKLGKNDFNRKHALTLLADEEQQAFMDAEDDLDDAVDQLTICNNRAIVFGLLR